VKQVNQIKDQKAAQSAFDTACKFLTIPAEYRLKMVRSCKQNDQRVRVFRCEKLNGENNGLGGEHFSFTVDQSGYQILGVTWMDQRFAKGHPLPSKRRTAELAKEFLESIQPGLFDRLENHWIRPHDEVITVNGEKMTVTGMKYKCYMPEKDTWAWVIIGPDEKVITFEQGIKWVNGRVTEKWLHDSWLKNNG
jgi:hypothetical protein